MDSLVTYQGPKTLAEFYAQRDGWRTCTNTKHPHHWNKALPNGNYGSEYAPRPYDGPYQEETCAAHAPKKRGRPRVRSYSKTYRDKHKSTP
jgi:hypothetical protein